MIKIGIGYDLHRLEKGRRFILGGVEIPFHKGEIGHSDGDVLAHAICDALLGASALGDIGELFPSVKLKWKDANSMKLLADVFMRVKQAGYKINNIDCVVVCESPKILPYREEIRKAIADVLELPCGSVFIKGKTSEKLGPIGKGKAVEAFAQCLLESNDI